MDKIDFVYTWVDGTDSTWVDKKNRYLKRKDSINSDARFRDYNILMYSLRSVEKYAPWVHKIYLVTDNQYPEWLKDNQKLSVITHEDFLSKNNLPLFNSNAIELNLDKIRGLEEKFVYFNDDMLLLNPVKPSDFFRDGKPCDNRIYTVQVNNIDFAHIVVQNDICMNQYLKGKWPLSGKDIIDIKYGFNNFRNIMLLPWLRKGMVPGYHEEHGPVPFLKSSFKKSRKIWLDEFTNTSSHKFRQMNDISIWLVRHLQLETGNFIPYWGRRNIYHNVTDVKHIDKALKSKKAKSLCINDADTDKHTYSVLKEKITKLLEKKFPKKSVFEK